MASKDIISNGEQEDVNEFKSEADEFRERGYQMVDMVADYLSNLDSRNPFPDVKPGYLRESVRDEAPQEPDTWEDLVNDIEPMIMRGVAHWQHPNFHAYYPFTTSYPSMLGDILANAINSNGYTWTCGPVCTELEVHMMNWLGKMLNLPQDFLFTSNGHGGGIIMATSGEATTCCMLAARDKAIKKIKGDNPNMEEGEILSKLVAYTSDEAHTCVRKSAVVAGVQMRILESEGIGSLNKNRLQEAILQDKSNGLFPFFFCATLGTTPCCAFDDLKELGLVCAKDDIWVHVDSAYAGAAFICPEFQPLLAGIEHVTSFTLNMHKWLPIHFDCTGLWIKDSRYLTNAFKLNANYLIDFNKGSMPDYTHWNIHLSRKFRSLKLWFVLRLYGVKKLQEVIRKDVRLAKQFEDFVKSDDRFEIVAPAVMGLVAFRMKGENSKTSELLRLINEDRRIHMVSSSLHGKTLIRFVIIGYTTSSKHVCQAWNVITEMANKIESQNCTR